MNFGKPIVLLDLECTGGDKQFYSICEIGAVILNQYTLEVESEFESLVAPYKFTKKIVRMGEWEDIPAHEKKAMDVHKIPMKTLMKAPSIDRVLDMFQMWIVMKTGKSERHVCLSSWGAYFDLPYLVNAYETMVRQYPFDRKYLDIKGIARWMFALMDKPFTKGGTRKCSKLLGIPYEGTQHRALDDAKQAAKILQSLYSLTKDTNFSILMNEEKSK